MRIINQLKRRKSGQTILKWLFDCFLFFKENKELSKNYLEEIKQIKDIKIYDDVYIKINNQVYNAWVMSKNINSIIVGYSIDDRFEEYTFNIRGMWNKTQVIQKDFVLILNQADL